MRGKLGSYPLRIRACTRRGSYSGTSKSKLYTIVAFSPLPCLRTVRLRQTDRARASKRRRSRKSSNQTVLRRRDIAAARRPDRLQAGAEAEGRRGRAAAPSRTLEMNASLED